jgi:hypothetical protein
VLEGKLPDQMRSQFWIKCAGIARYKSFYLSDYYQCLIAADANKQINYPNRHFA